MSFESVVSELVPPLAKSRNYGDNAIVHKKALIVGAMGKGKSKLMESMALEVRRLRPDGFVGFSETASITATLTDGVRAPARTWFFKNDDLTLARISPEDVNHYYQIRHLISARTRQREGLVITAMGIHRFHGLDVNLGSEFDQLWVKSLPDRPADRSTLLGYFDHLPRYKRRNGEECNCKGCQFERMGEPEEKALVRLSNGQALIVDVPFPTSSILHDLKRLSLGRIDIAVSLAVGTALLAAVLLVWVSVIVRFLFA